jgi:hypothetical protein
VAAGLAAHRLAARPAAAGHTAARAAATQAPGGLAAHRLAAGMAAAGHTAAGTAAAGLAAALATALLRADGATTGVDHGVRGWRFLGGFPRD